MGRYREYADNAARQKAYRERQKQAQQKRGTGQGRVPIAQRQKLAAILGMLGSAHADRVVALDMAEQFVRKSGFTWYDFFNVEQPVRRSRK